MSDRTTIGVAYGPSINGNVATYAVLALAGADTYRVCRLAVSRPNDAPTIRQARRMPATGAVFTMRHGPGQLDTVMIHPGQPRPPSTPWRKPRPVVRLPEVEPVSCRCGCGSLVAVALPDVTAV
jgi:hypothetical protein